MYNEDRLFANDALKARGGQGWYDLACERGFIRRTANDADTAALMSIRSPEVELGDKAKRV